VLHLENISPSDAGAYSLRAANAAGAATSPPATLSVHAPDRRSGPWECRGRNLRRTNHCPAVLGRHTFVPVWQIPLVHPSYYPNPPIIANGLAYLSLFAPPEYGEYLKAVDLATGTSVWQSPMPYASSLPVWHGGRIHTLEDAGEGSALIRSLDASSGTTLLSRKFSVFDIVGARLLVADSGFQAIMGGWNETQTTYAFDPDGALRFLQTNPPGASLPGLSQYPSRERIFKAFRSSLSEFDPVSGTEIWSLKLPFEPDTEIRYPNTPIIEGHRAVVAKLNKNGNIDLACIDTSSRTILWHRHIESSHYYSSYYNNLAMALAQDTIYLAADITIQSYSLSDGQPGPVIQTPSKTPIQQIIVFDDALAATNSHNAYLFDRPSGDLLQTLGPGPGLSYGGGSLAYSDGYLLTTGADGILRAYFAARPPALDASAAPALNRQTGLYEQTLTVTNHEPVAIPGFDLRITGLPEGVCVWNASDRTEDAATVEFRQPLAAGATATIILEYYAKTRGGAIQPTVTAALVTKPETDPAAPDGGFAIDRAVRLTDGTMLVEFTATPGALYEVHYSADAVHWKLSPVRIRAAGNRVQWIDRGPPRTDTPPSEAPTRFYRVNRLP